ncbi:hypothetical protein [Halalkalibacterium ligniniphilum]|uniref:hypothetical protein n=1 Tax=Halalkalibacterium ligniniphilum TaxID=1134413 RepID=UPI00034BD45E|nr:hypothetical protein [Halalkalibacterium ligniniphilum]
MNNKPHSLKNVIDYRFAQTIGFWKKFEAFKNNDYISSGSKFYLLTNFASITAEIVNTFENLDYVDWEDEEEAIFPFLSQSGKELIQLQERIPGQEKIDVKNYHEMLVLKNVELTPYGSEKTIRMQQMLLFSDQIVGMTFGEDPERDINDD